MDAAAAAGPSSPIAWLALDGEWGALPRALPVAGPRCVIGRNPTSTIASTNPCVSGVHCVLVRQAATQSQAGTQHMERGFFVMLADMSSNGCSVNGERLGKGATRMLREGDVVELVVAKKVGLEKFNCRLTFHYGAPPAAHDAAAGAAAGGDAPAADDAIAADGSAASDGSTSARPPEAELKSRDVTSDYELDMEKCLGSGSFASVYRATCRRDGQAVAVKIINKKRLALYVDPDERAKHARNIERQKREVDILLSARHAHVVQCHAVYETDERLCFVLTFAAGGELFGCLKRLGNAVPEPIVRVVAFQVAKGLQYLHSVGVVHRDLKLENLLLLRDVPSDVSKTDEIAAQMHVVISDFGLSRVLHHETSLMTTMCGTPVYVAPEVVDVSRREDVKGYTPAVDMYSLGVVVYALLTGRPPFPFACDEHGRRVKNRINYKAPFAWPVGSNVSRPAQQFVENLLTLIPAPRMTAAEALEHEWLLVMLDEDVATVGSKRPRA